MKTQIKLVEGISMSYQQLVVAVVAISVLGLLSCSQETQRLPTTDLSPDKIEGDNFRLERAYLVTLHVPNADVERVLKAVVSEVGLHYGKYDQVAYLDAPGFEQYRPIAGSKAGEQDNVSREPTTRVHFSVTCELDVLRRALNAAHSAHSYEEPVFYIREVWRSRSTSPDDSNPNRWWNQEP